MSRSMKSISRCPLSHVFQPLRASGFFIFLALFTLPSLAEFAGGDGSPEDPFLVETATHLDAVRDYAGSNFVQVAHIDLGEAPWNEGDGWTPIGSSGTPFQDHLMVWVSVLRD